MHLFADWLDAVLSAKALGIALWAGLAVITVILLVLSRTRWGQAKPLSKCVALSIFAHVLLIGYAYGTKLIFDYPVPTANEPTQLTILANDRLNESPEDAAEQEIEPWNRFVSQEAVQPDVFQPGRQTVEFTEDIQRHVQADAPEIETFASQDASHMHQPQRPVAEPSQPTQPLPTQPVDQVASVERPEVAPQPRESEQQMFGPGASDLPRMRNAKVQLPQFDNPRADRNPSGSVTDADPTLPALSDIPFSATSAEALKAARDAARRDLIHSNLPRTPSSRKPGNDELAHISGTPTKPSTKIDPSLRRLGDGQPLPDAFRLRFSGDRLQVAQQYGGNEQTEAAIQAALAWLAEQQRPDGRWDANAHGAGWETKVLGHDRKGAGTNADTGVTGLALLAFLGAGQTHFEGEYDKHVRRGLEFLLASQATDGNLAGHARFFARMYCHGMATLALSEAYAVTGDHRLKPAVERAAAYIVAAQHPTSGGWRYHPGDEIGDMSQFGWQVMSLKSAEMAGIPIPDATRTRMIKFLRDCSSGSHGGLASYRPGEIPSRSMTAEALVCRLFLDQADRATLDEAATFIDQRRPDGETPNLYYWYYATLGLRQINDGRWDRWNKALQTQLIGRQRQNGRLAGSWDHDTVWGAYGGRIYSTALAALCLESYYRYLPLFKQQ